MKAYNLYMQASAADVYVFRDSLRMMREADMQAMYRDLTNSMCYGLWGDSLAVRKSMHPQYPYHVCRPSGSPESHHETEAAAVAAAERCAQREPGVSFYVTKAITRSYVEKQPSITTRL